MIPQLAKGQFPWLEFAIMPSIALRAAKTDSPRVSIFALAWGKNPLLKCPSVELNARFLRTAISSGRARRMCM